MRKLIALLLTLLLMFSSAAFAENETWMEYDFGDFTMSFPIDIIGAVTEERVSNQPFMQVFQDYDANALVNKTLNCVWNENIFDIAAIDPAEFARMLKESFPMQMEAAGVGVSACEILAAAHDEHKGQPSLSVILVSLLDYSAFGGPAEYALYTIQTLVSGENIGGSYTFTISTDDIGNTQLLMEIMDTISWKA